MYIKNIHIASFGKLKDKELNLSEGLNIIKGDNESGKSTLSMFIRFMFYGFASGAKQNITDSDKKHYLPWDGSPASGSMTVVKDGEEFVIERNNAGKSDTVSVTRKLDGAVIKCPDGVGEYFLGIPSATYSGSAQSMQCDGPKTGGRELAEQIQNILFSADENISVKKASELLGKERTLIDHQRGRGGTIPELEDEIEQLEAEFEQSKKDNAEYIFFKGEYEKNSEKLKDSKEKYEKLEKEYDDLKLYEKTFRLEELDKARALFKEKQELCKEKRSELPEDYDDEMNDRLTAALESYRSAFSVEKEAKEHAASVSKQIDMMNDIRDKESVNGDIAQYKKAKNGSRMGKLLSVLFAVAAVIVLVLAIVFPKSKSLLFAAAAVFAVIALAMLVYSLYSSKKSEKLAKSYGVDREGFYKAAKAAIAAREKYDSLRSEQSAAIKAFESAKAKASESRAAVGKLLVTQAESFEQVQSEAVKLREKIMEYAKVKGEFGNCEYALKQLEASVNEEELRNIRNTVPKPTRPESAVSTELKLYRSKVDVYTQKLTGDSGKLGALEASAKDPALLFSELEQKKAELASEIKRRDALLLAISVLEGAGAELKAGVSPKITHNAEELLMRSSKGRYSKLVADKDFMISVLDGESVRSIEYLSSGTQDIVYIAFRYGLLKLLYKGEPPVMIFDDAFARIDDKRLSELASVLYAISDNTQTVILTCHDREQRFLADKNVKIINI